MSLPILTPQPARKTVLVQCWTNGCQILVHPNLVVLDIARDVVEFAMSPVLRFLNEYSPDWMQDLVVREDLWL